LSGLDEQYEDIPECPNCEKRPAYWTLSNSLKIPMCQVNSKSWSLVGLRGLHISGDTISFYTGYSCMDDIERRVAYVWCRECGTANYDRTFINFLIKVAKRLEKTKYVMEE